MILVPGEDSITGNVTGGLRFARYVLAPNTRLSASAFEPGLDVRAVTWFAINFLARAKNNIASVLSKWYEMAIGRSERKL